MKSITGGSRHCLMAKRIITGCLLGRLDDVRFTLAYTRAITSSDVDQWLSRSRLKSIFSDYSFCILFITLIGIIAKYIYTIIV